MAFVGLERYGHNMSKIKLLDCTLRDGGYINEWNFGNHTIKDILRKLVESGVDYVETGFLRNCEYTPDKSVFNFTYSARKAERN